MASIRDTSLFIKFMFEKQREDTQLTIRLDQSQHISKPGRPKSQEEAKTKRRKNNIKVAKQSREH